MRRSVWKSPFAFGARAAVVAFALLLSSVASAHGFGSLVLQADTPEVELVYPITDPVAPGAGSGGMVNLGDPENIQNEVLYDPVTGQYIMSSSVGGSFD
ncbi:MAG: hypothetical protein JNM49_08895, partial [Flavobacteriales bacterium]|nr:hypothetical protein [Flavobacteriales bacterium]